MKLYQGVPRYTYKELRDLPTITVGQADDLKVETETATGAPCRVWLSRLTFGDDPAILWRYTAYVEVYNRRTGKWETSVEYNAERTSEAKFPNRDEEDQP